MLCVCDVFKIAMCVLLCQFNRGKLKFKVPFFEFICLSVLKSIFRNVIEFCCFVPVSYLQKVSLPEIVLCFLRSTLEFDCYISLKNQIMINIGSKQIIFKRIKRLSLLYLNIVFFELIPLHFLGYSGLFSLWFVLLRIYL